MIQLERYIIKKKYVDSNNDGPVTSYFLSVWLPLQCVPQMCACVGVQQLMYSLQKKKPQPSQKLSAFSGKPWLSVGVFSCHPCPHLFLHHYICHRSQSHTSGQIMSLEHEEKVYDWLTKKLLQSPICYFRSPRTSGSHKQRTHTTRKVLLLLFSQWIIWTLGLSDGHVVEVPLVISPVMGSALKSW